MKIKMGAPLPREEKEKMRDVRHYSSRTPESSWKRLADEVSTYVRAQTPEPNVVEVTGKGAESVAAMLRLGTAVRVVVVPDQTTRTDVHVVGLARFRVHAVDRVGGTVMQPAAPRQSASGGTLPIGTIVRIKQPKNQTETGYLYVKLSRVWSGAQQYFVAPCGTANAVRGVSRAELEVATLARTPPNPPLPIGAKVYYAKPVSGYSNMQTVYGFVDRVQPYYVMQASRTRVASGVIWIASHAYTVTRSGDPKKDIVCDVSVFQHAGFDADIYPHTRDVK
jgi:hypothetical protein